MRNFNPHTLLIYIGYILAAISGIIHFYLGFRIGITSILGASFLLAGIGFYLGIGLIRANRSKKKVYLAGIPFTGGQILLWYILNNPSIEAFLRGEPFLEVIDKISQVLLVILLIYLYHKEE